jgi:hypothetical protein
VSLLIALVVAAAAPATPVGSKSSVEAMQGLQAYGRCVVAEQPAKVRALLALDFKDPNYGNGMQRLMDRRPACPGVALPKGDLATGSLAVGGALAEGLLRRDGALLDLGARTAYRPELPNIEARNGGEVMALCTVRENPAAAARLLETEAGSKGELEALAGVGPTVSGCIPAKTEAKFTRESLRALIALGAYRLATHNAQQVAK